MLRKVAVLSLGLWILFSIQVAEAKCLLLDDSGDCMDGGKTSGVEQSSETGVDAISMLSLPIAAVSAVAIGTIVYFRWKSSP